MAKQSSVAVGDRFSRLVVTARAADLTKGRPRWQCQCDCGVITIVWATSLRSGKTRSCGCLKQETAKKRGPLLQAALTRRLTAVGDRYGRLTIVSRAPDVVRGTPPKGLLRWNCRCDCGTTKIVEGRDIRSGHTQSCGCLSRERAAAQKYIHGLHKTPEYRVWSCMRINARKKGIHVSSRWRSVEAFLADVGPRPSSKHRLTRWPNIEGNYESGNVRWATRKEQPRVMSKETCAKLAAAGRGRTPSAETRAKLSAKFKGRFVSDDTRAKLRAARARQAPLSAETLAKIATKNRARSAESRERTAAISRERWRQYTPEERTAIGTKLSTALKGRKRSQTHSENLRQATLNRSPEMRARVRAKLSAAGTGRVPSPEARTKMSANMYRRMGTPEARAKMRAVHLGAVFSPERRQRMSVAMKGIAPEVRAAIQAASKRAFEERRAEISAKLSAAGRGRSCSPETRTRISVSARAREYSTEALQKLRDNAERVLHTPEAKAKARAVNRTIRRSPPAHGKRVWYTRSDGTRVCFRSTWEATFAAWLDVHCLDWAFEPRTFPVDYMFNGESITGTYTPDFLVGDVWYEVKGWWRAQGRAKFEAFRAAYPDQDIRVIDEQWFVQQGFRWRRKQWQLTPTAIA